MNKFKDIDEENSDLIISKSNEELLKIENDILHQIKINYEFVDDIDEKYKYQMSREIRKNNTVGEIQEYLLSEIVKYINTLDNIKIYRLVSSVQIYKVGEDRNWLAITSRFQK